MLRRFISPALSLIYPVILVIQENIYIRIWQLETVFLILQWLVERGTLYLCLGDMNMNHSTPGAAAGPLTGLHVTL